MELVAFRGTGQELMLMFDNRRDLRLRICAVIASVTCYDLDFEFVMKNDHIQHKNTSVKLETLSRVYPADCSKCENA